ncbi:diguanylate cyclase domain-containing protein [Hydrogenovibrio halophilus]|uniref:diguanylate cyclase domain-containing protein n=1 Tax=Hydrogenovibrio halophilus TaxID=373391 RepID=UPI0012FD75B0|nr:diguanylate cyclase [Hydrogenovibrio halophilus]
MAYYKAMTPSLSKNLKQVYRRFFWPIALIGALALVLHLTQTLRLTQEMFRLELDTLSQQVHHRFADAQKTLQGRYVQIARIYQNQPAFVKRMQAGDPQSLYKYLKADYQDFREQMPQLYVMHLVDSHNVTQLRLHKPESWGDDLTEIRPMMAAANRTGDVQKGFEAGKNGITYRVSVPLKTSSGQALGVLEFGIEPDYFTADLSEQYDVATRLLVPEAKLTHLTREVRFDSVGRYRAMTADPEFDLLQVGHEAQARLLHHHGQTYAFVSDLTLPDYRGQGVVKVQVLKDITERYDRHYHQLFVQVGLNVLALILMLTLLHILLRRFQLASIRSERQLRHLRSQNRAFQESNERDELTGCFNRRFFNKCLRRLLARGGPDASHALLFFDIDHFKRINDQKGHLVGDDILIELAQFVNRHVRDHDALIRWGGEEFALVLEEVDLTEATDVAEKLRQGVKARTWPGEVEMTLSFGVTLLKPDDDLETLQARVDRLLYTAKDSGRDTVCSG